MEDLAAAFKLKAQELMNLIAGRTPPPGSLEAIRDLFNQARRLYDAGQVEEAIGLLTQAIEKANKR